MGFQGGRPLDPKVDAHGIPWGFPMGSHGLWTHGPFGPLAPLDPWALGAHSPPPPPGGPMGVTLGDPRGPKGGSFLDLHQGVIKRRSPEKQRNSWKGNLRSPRKGANWPNLNKFIYRILLTNLSWVLQVNRLTFKNGKSY